MKNAVKWILVITGAIVALIVIAVIVLPMVIDVEQYKPQIEQQVTKATGRSFRLGGELKASVFPWIGVRLSDLHLGNPPGFQEPDFVSVASFEVRVKLLPLLSRNIEVKRFVVNKPVIVLEKRKDGKGGWEGLGQPAMQEKAPGSDEKAPADAGGLPIKGLVVGEFAITDGRIVWLDQAGGTRKEVEAINLALTNVSLTTPIGVAFSALADQKPVKLDGTIGPLGTEPGQIPLPLDLVAGLLNQLEIKLNGRVDPSTAPPTFDLGVEVAEFSPRKLLAQLGQPLLLETADATVLEAVAVKLALKGNPQDVTVSDGTLKLDDSQATFSARAKEFDKPNLAFDLDLDRIDLDRYLPPPTQGKAAPEASTPAPEKTGSAKTDYTPLRRLVMDARIKAGDLKVKNARLQNIEVRVNARDGVIQLDPLKLDLYQGNLAGSGTINVQKAEPATQVQVKLNGVQAGPLIKDVMAKDLIEGILNAAINLDVKGDAPATIRRTLDGQGNVRFNDGAIVGIDLASMVRNVQASFGLAGQTAQKPRTDFSELQLPFTITKGVFRTDASRLASPLMRVQAAGSADLDKEMLDFRVEPKFVATIKGQGDTKQRSGIMVPVLVSGSFEAPRFTPDLKALVEQQFDQALPDKQVLEKILPTKEGADEQLQKGVKEVLKKLPFGN